jgi:predicted Zn-dependent protease
MDFAGKIFPVDTALMRRATSMMNAPLIAQEHFQDSLSVGVPNTDRAFFGLLLAKNLYNKEEYKTCTAILNEIRGFSPDNHAATLLLIDVKRNTADYKGALTMIDDMLTENQEDVMVIAQKAKVLLTMKQDKEAAVLAKQAMLLAPDDISSLEAQALVYYLTGNKQQSNELLEDIRTTESAFGDDNTVSDRLGKVLDGTVSYR